LVCRTIFDKNRFPLFVIVLYNAFMARILIEEALLFLVPFALYLVWRLIRRQREGHQENNTTRSSSLIEWNGAGFWIIFTGLLFGILSLLYSGLTQERGKGSYVPVHIEDGRIIPGQFR
jgi:Ca2+/Na+ antiporter